MFPSIVCFIVPPPGSPPTPQFHLCPLNTSVLRHPSQPLPFTVSSAELNNIHCFVLTLISERFPKMVQNHQTSLLISKSISEYLPQILHGQSNSSCSLHKCGIFLPTLPTSAFGLTFPGVVNGTPSRPVS